MATIHLGVVASSFCIKGIVIVALSVVNYKALQACINGCVKFISEIGNDPELQLKKDQLDLEKTKEENRMKLEEEKIKAQKECYIRAVEIGAPDVVVQSINFQLSSQNPDAEEGHDAHTPQMQGLKGPLDALNQDACWRVKTKVQEMP